MFTIMDKNLLTTKYGTNVLVTLLGYKGLTF